MITAKMPHNPPRRRSGPARILCICLAVLLTPAAAVADTDYRCLSACKRNGGTTAHCMTDCSFRAPSPSLPPARAEGEAHKEFAAPVPAEQVRIPAPQTMESAAGARMTALPVCVQRCLKEKLQYPFCTERCARPQP